MPINTSLSPIRPIYHDALDTIAVIGIMAMMCRRFGYHKPWMNSAHHHILCHGSLNSIAAAILIFLVIFFFVFLAREASRKDLEARTVIFPKFELI